MSAITNIKYDDLEKNYEYGNETVVFNTNTYSINISSYDENENLQEFRCNLTPLLTFLKHKLKDVDWRYMNQSRNTKWGYKRFAEEELFNLLNDGRVITSN